MKAYVRRKQPARCSSAIPSPSPPASPVSGSGRTADARLLRAGASQMWIIPGSSHSAGARRRARHSPAHPSQAIGADRAPTVTNSLLDILIVSTLKTICVFSDDSSLLAFQPDLAQTSFSSSLPGAAVPQRCRAAAAVAELRRPRCWLCLCSHGVTRKHHHHCQTKQIPESPFCCNYF